MYVDVTLIYHPVNCEWGDWIIGDCSKTCGVGTRYKTRTPKVSAEHGGKECNGSTSAKEDCNFKTCPGITTPDI